MTDDTWPHCWRVCCKCLNPVEMLAADAKTSGSLESIEETQYTLKPALLLKNVLPL